MGESHIVTTWMKDSYTRESLHRNLGGLSKDASYLGHIERKKDVDGDWSWGYVVKGQTNVVPCATYARARKQLEEAVQPLIPLEDFQLCGKCGHKGHPGTVCRNGMGCHCG